MPNLQLYLANVYPRLPLPNFPPNKVYPQPQCEAVVVGQAVALFGGQAMVRLHTAPSSD